jgi:NADH:ubiquinone oxidoreductase subunit 5 (subunit L)/multisubunit Na+/H+ antiporter MnhA subunit
MSGKIYYIAALLGAFFTAASFLKLGHAAFLGKPSKDISGIKEASWMMLIPMIVIASGCILFGVFNPLPLKGLIQPILGARLEGHDFSGLLPHNWTIAIVSIIVLLFALLNHMYGVNKTKRSLGAVDHIHHAPVLSNIYGWAEKRYFDPYDIGMFFVNVFAKALHAIDRAIDWFYNTFCVWVATTLSTFTKKIFSGEQSAFVTWSLLGILIVVISIVILK